ncbi:hypothetical protein [Bradyrhizobium sp. SZCCHNS3053]|uniref:hypothetical protein n=1 Tax=Bradyrhizobium sp. SZCCHNS3053 TaxID=3057322 RepID=UPI0029165977|nr:hypothetical protein [Bradyrhizobium sp. SZCCHNS3053]
MTYSCTDFTDDILDALGIQVPQQFNDSPSDQADLALAEIERLQSIEKVIRDNLTTVIAALQQTELVDHDNGRIADAEDARAVIKLLQALPEKAAPIADEEDEEDENDDAE